MKPTAMATTDIKFTEDPTELEAVYRFRYGIYCEEMRRAQIYADHKRRTIREPLDDDSRMMVAYQNGELVATLRFSFAREADLGYYPALYNMAAVGAAFPQQVSISTKFMMLPRCRRSTLAVRMIMASWPYGMKEGIRYDFMDCNPHLEAFFTGMGYRPACGRVQHPEYGDVQPMVLDLHDMEHLRLVGSPLATLGAKRITPQPSPLTL